MSDKPDILRIELTPSHVVDEDTIDPAKLGPTVAQLVEMHQQGTLQPRDLAGHLAIVAAFIARGVVPPPEYVGENPEPIAPEVRAMLGEHLVRKAGWEHAKRSTANTQMRCRLGTLSCGAWPTTNFPTSASTPATLRTRS